MKKRILSDRQSQTLFAGIATVLFIFVATSLTVAQSADFKAGDKVEVLSSGTWYKAEVLETKDGTYKIHYEGWSSTWDEWVTPAKMRNIGATSPARTTAGAGASTATKPADQLPSKYKPGDRVECDKASIDSWEKGTVMPFLKNDFKDGRHYRVRLDSFARGGMYLDGHECRVENIRPLAGAAYKNEATAVPVGVATVDGDNTLSADRPIMACPVEQTAVKTGAAPNTELFKKIIRCRKGEKAASTGYDGAVTVDVTALQVGASRKWIYGEDIGGKPGTTIYPVKATFHYKTFYRGSTQVSQNWIRVLNFYVNEFGEWAIGSEVSVKAGETVNIPRDQ